MRTAAAIALAIAVGCMSLASTAAASTPIQSLQSIRDAATDHALEAALAATGGDVQVRGGRLDSRLRLKRCDGPLEAFRPAGGRAVGAGTVGVRCLGAAGWTVYVPVWVSVQAEVMVLSRPVPRGTVLTARDVSMEMRDVAKLRTGYLTETEQVLGMRTVRSLDAGSVLRPRSLKKPNLVSRGRTVTILLRSGGLELRATGTALADGALGDVVAVRNIKSKRKVEGTVSAPGVVSVRR